MKKILITLTIIGFSVSGFAQQSIDVNEPLQDSAFKAVTTEDRLSMLEKEIKELKSSNALLEKQLADVKKQFPVRKKKVIVSRKSSKQGVWVD